MKKIIFTLLVPVLLFLSSCATYKVKYSKESKDWETKHVAPTNQKITHSMYLIGDSGNAYLGKPLPPALELLRRKLATADENSSVLFLGDNIYPHGFPPKNNDKEYKLSQYRLDAQLEILENYKGRIVFMPGNHDWSKYGLKGVKRQEKYIEKKLNKGIEDKDDWENYFLPDRGCSGPEVVEINEQLVVIIVDSQWYLRDWDKEPEINDGCEMKSRKDFAFYFEEVVRKHRSKNVVIAMHHPMYSYGPHGGHFTVKEHLFPLTQYKNKLYVPLPGIGTLAALYRSTIGISSDLTHINYKALFNDVMAGATKNGSYIFAAGHEHNMQYIEQERQHFIVSGAGSKKTPVHLGKGAEFGYGHSGFAQIDFYEDGSSWLQFWAPEKDGSAGKVVFRKQLKGKLEVSEENIPEAFPEYEQDLKTKVSTVTSNKITEKGPLHYFFLGEHFRNLYAREYEFPVLDMQTFRGGVTIIKRGGGNQTNSLRLRDADGKQIVMRSLTKDASRTVPYPINKMTAAEGIVQETFLSSHPFAALAIPPLADAVQVYHTNPELYYVPKQPGLGVHNGLFGGEVYLIEERAGGNWKGVASLGNSKKLISTIDVADEIAENHKSKVDQKRFLRSRLFDQVIGDWDRHDDQWRWAKIKVNKDSTAYQAIPRDRDQPFSKYDGFLVKCARLFMPFLRQLKEYKPDIKNMKWSSWSPKYVDNSFLNEMDWEDWERETKYIQANLTDEIIDEAFKVWPKIVQELTAEEIKSVMKKRRDRLLKFAKQHYDLLYKKVDVYGTEKDERFVIERLDDENTRIRVYHKRKKGDRLVFDRTFQRSVTKEIAVYGLGDDDDFEVTGETNKGIKIRLIGGLGEDKFIDKSKVSGLSKKTIVYDNKEKNEFDLGTESKNNVSKRRDLNIYDRRHYHYEYNFTIPLPLLGFNPDDGFFLGANIINTRYGFKKSPYASLHQFRGDIAFATKGINMYYLGDFVDVVGDWNVMLEGIFRTDRSAFNYFGLGNNTALTTDDFDFNRVRQSLIRIYPAFKKSFTSLGAGFTVGPIFEQSSIDNTDVRFIDGNNTDLSADIFEKKYFGGFKVGFDGISKDNIQIPTRGAHFSVDATLMTNLEATEQDFSLLNSSLTIYQNIDQKARLVLATKVGVAHRTGDYPFYHSAILGSDLNLRGYRSERFYGQTAFYHNTDLRLKLFSSINKILPFTLGILGGADYGRVWLDDEQSDKWHSGYGGGLWFAPVDFIVMNFTYFVTDEDSRFALRFGFDF